MRASELESRQGMVELRVFPGVGGVTLGAVIAKLPIVFVILDVAGDTLLSCALVDAVSVAIFTTYVDVSACKREG